MVSIAVTKQKAVPSIEFSTAGENLERVKEVEDTMLDPWEPCAEGPEDFDASSTTPKAGMPLSTKLSKKNLLVIRFPRL